MARETSSTNRPGCKPWGLRSSFAGTSQIKFTGPVFRPSQRQTFAGPCTPEQRKVYQRNHGCRQIHFFDGTLQLQEGLTVGCLAHTTGCCRQAHTMFRRVCIQMQIFGTFFRKFRGAAVADWNWEGSLRVFRGMRRRRLGHNHRTEQVFTTPNRLFRDEPTPFPRPS
jgi:hypothetical protein